jgi:hypothetical protein
LPDVEIIYLSKENSIKESIQPKVKIHDNFEIEKSEKIKNDLFKKSVNQNKEKNHKKRFTVVFICFIILIPALATSYNAGFLPISQLLEIKEPIGNFKEITLSGIAEKYHIIESIPELNKIKHNIYTTDEKLSIVSKCYILEIENEGYNLKHEGTKNIEGFNVHYLGFIKGITAIVILMTDDNIDINNINTFIIYSTGSIFDYKQMFEKYGNYLSF